MKDNFWNIWTTGVALLLFVFAFGYAGAGDLEEAERIQAEYCENVKSGAWPDFNKTYKEECK
jgi:hypothetical protein